MKVIEQLAVGKFNDDRCEDAISVTDDYIAVIDGVTSKSDFLFEGKKDGRLISEILVSAFKGLKKDDDSKHLSAGPSSGTAFKGLKKDADCKAAVDYLNSFIREWYKEHKLYDKLKNNLLERPAASAIIYSKFRREIWVIGDCLCRCNGTVFQNKLEIDKLYTDLRIKFIKYLLDTRYCTEQDLLANDISQEPTKLIMKTQPFIRNKNDGSKYNHTVIDGFDTVTDLIKTIKVPKHTKELIFCSDGYPEILPTLAETESYLKYVLENDPLCYKIYKHFKGVSDGAVSFDDRAYVRFEI